MMKSLGLDIGSTTVKLAVIDENHNLIHSSYRRHRADIKNTISEMLNECMKEIGDVLMHASVTGSGGISFSGRLGIPFVQEVIAVTTAMKEEREDTDVIIELGGEDAKIVFLTNGVEQRMNGICAGGTGAFIDQMAALLQMTTPELNECAKKSERIYPIAARCGVFAKSDIQPLINDGVSKNDLAASIFKAVVDQTISGLACGRKIRGNVAFLGGPLFFLSELRASFIKTLEISYENVVFPKNAHLFAAMGTAMKAISSEGYMLSDLLERVGSSDEFVMENSRMQALFEKEEEYRAFNERNERNRIPRVSLSEYEGKAFFGVDAGSTTTKAVLIGEEGELLYSFYASNRGEPVQVLKNAFRKIKEEINDKTDIVYSCSTGYGEELFKEAFSLDEGEVETIAHTYAARVFDNDVDCIIDIGGQDMKYIRIKDGIVDNILLNEACSSGCGSFIENFASSLGYSAPEFADLAVKSKAPIDLGTRCTVFMNSNVKQAQKEGVPTEDIAAGLSYSVVKNALFKVIKLTDVSQLGKKVIVQGGTFLNDSVLRAFEIVAGCEAIRPDIAGLMGAYGAALIAKERYHGKKTSMPDLDSLISVEFETESATCRKCQNYCRLTINKFSNGNRYISGNRCENCISSGEKKEEIPDLMEYKKKRLFAYEVLDIDKASRGVIGLPRVLNMYEDYPFWATFFRCLKFRTVLSPFSDREIFQLGMDSIPSESECYPAKLAHGHVQWLIKSGVDRIFYPCVVYEQKETDTATNNFNCPMVMSYPENIRNNVDEIEEVTFMQPFISFSDVSILKKRLIEEFSDIPSAEVSKACDEAWREFIEYKNDVRAEGERVLRWLKDNGRSGIVVAGRPYHIDPEVNHGINKMITTYGYAVLTEDSVAHLNRNDSSMRVVDQWVFHSRLYNAAKYVAEHENLELVQLNSFGCGLDAITVEGVSELLEKAGKLYTLLKIDEISNLGAARIRIRSLFAARKMRPQGQLETISDYMRVPYTKKMNDEGYTILCPGMTFPLCDFISAAAGSCGYNIVMLENEGQNVIDAGLKYVNNDACYPAMIVTGQLLDAVMSGKYNTDKLAVMMVQTGGGCRATNYIGFLRKALTSAGMDHIPVVSLNLNGIETNPGFKISNKLAIKGIQASMFADILNQMTYKVRPYEKILGTTDAMYEKWCSIIKDTLGMDHICVAKFYSLCRKMIHEFDHIEIDESIVKPKVGIVGEVLVKFMPTANNHLAKTLENEGAEVVIPEMLEFFKYCIGNEKTKHEKLGKSKKGVYISKAGLMGIEIVQWPIKRALDKSMRFRKPHDIEHTRLSAQEVLSLGNYCGEGWFLAGETIDLIKSGVHNVVCVQPFGCLPNHVVGKGIIKKIKSMYPQSNIVAVDYDPSASKVNQINRIKLMLETAEASMKA